MNCNSFANVVVDLARSETLDRPVRDAGLAHASMCAACGKRLAEETLLTGGLKALSAELKTLNAPNRLQHNLVSVFHQQSFVSPVPQRNDRWRYLAIAAALVMAVAFGIVAYSIRQQSEGSQAAAVPPAEVRPPDNSIEVKQITPPVKPAVAVVPRKTVRRPEVINRTRKPRATVPVQSTFVTVVVGAVADPEPEIMSPFMPVSYSNPVNVQESAQVVRVELPRYAMARFGLPINMERYDERVKADVWLGADGLAKAIRFVQ